MGKFISKEAVFKIFKVNYKLFSFCRQIFQFSCNRNFSFSLKFYSAILNVTVNSQLALRQHMLERKLSAGYREIKIFSGPHPSAAHTLVRSGLGFTIPLLSPHHFSRDWTCLHYPSAATMLVQSRLRFTIPPLPPR